jgi:hypothetical protein
MKENITFGTAGNHDNHHPAALSIANRQNTQVGLRRY